MEDGTGNGSLDATDGCAFEDVAEISSCEGGIDPAR